MTAILPPLWEGAEEASSTRGEGRLDTTCAILYFSSFPVALPLTVSGTLCYSMGALSGWLWRLLTDHSKLAALEQAQLAASRVRSGWRPISHALSTQTRGCVAAASPPSNLLRNKWSLTTTTTQRRWLWLLRQSSRTRSMMTMTMVISAAAASEANEEGCGWDRPKAVC